MESQSSAKAELRRLHRLAKPLRVLHVACPPTSTGAAGALPGALARLGADVRVLMPASPSVLDSLADVQPEADLGSVLGQSPVRLLRAKVPGTNVPLWLLDYPTLHQRAGTPCHVPEANDSADNPLRYGVLCHVAAALALGHAGIAWRPEVVHCYDWHAGLVPLLLRRAGKHRPRSVFTVRDAASQGNFPPGAAALLEAPEAARDAEIFGRFSFLKCGLVHADKVTTASPTCARELRTPEFGCGMEGVFESRAADLHGILDGIDTEVWNPATDPGIARRYSIGEPAGKLACKAALQAQLGLRADPLAPIASFASGLTAHDMADVVLERLPRLLHDYPALQFALLGHGEHVLENGFAALARRFPDRMSVDIHYRESAAHPLHAGSDLLLRGARSEPCGSAQLHAMRYGTLPIVRRVGALADTVVDVQLHTRHRATGFMFDGATGDAFEGAVRRALGIFEAEPAVWRLLRLNAMLADFDWQAPAQRYLDLYSELASRDVARPLRRATVVPWLRASRARTGRISQSALARTGQAAAPLDEAAPCVEAACIA